ncbi:hypothetical protein PROFUN_09131 [Planoprotostelium fungivorum]|uniref:Uncharacterized protein n=1 Tax=Planoprotostelium fungivorum TaxID=1890364 RepID=A0A2P6NI18_9EUKA|nr:hypothetical protein PROFUN_09131 [Planoprotostelium fungivorum]
MANRIGVIVDDLKSSWYFRVYALLWLVCAITGFVGLIHFGKEATRLSNEHSQRSYLVKTDSQTFPNIGFLIPNNGPNGQEYQILSLDCTGPTVDGVNATTQPKLITKSCSDTIFFKEQKRCLYVQTDKVIKSVDEALRCVATFNNTVAGEHVEIIMSNDVNLARNPQYLVGTTQDITLSKIYKDDEFFFRRTANERNGASDVTLFHATFRFADLYEHHQVTDDDAYTRWQSAADIGGFGFFLYILHSIVMFFVSLFLENNSVFLNGGAKTGSYQNL